MGFADYPFTSRYLTVDGHRLHYIDEGQGPTLLFLHGNPTSSYLWRNVIKPLTAHYRCVALDLIGSGKTAKPDLDDRFLTH
ncbi:MAG: alpha/beta fold hydrolase, partial [Alcanivorax sp.]|nr:alpha/beta fold hydrolase [Alcanivorax sp.]